MLIQNEYNKSHYSDSSLQEFKQLIENKIRMAREELGKMSCRIEFIEQ